MKAAPFAYVRPGSVAGVVAELAVDDAKVVAGGQSLVPVLAMRLGRPGKLVDINAVAGLNTVVAGRKSVRLGATVRQRQAQSDPATKAVPLLRLALPWIGHREIRSRGTVCGSLAHADPAAELPAVACCLGATMTVVSARGKRQIAAADFFAAAMTTVLGADELLESVEFPVAGPAEGAGFAEVARRHGDFALAGVAVRVAGAAAGRPEATAACFGVSDRPVFRDISAWVADVVRDRGPEAPEPELRAGYAQQAGDFAAEVVTTAGDAHGSASYRKQLIAHLMAAQLARATAGSAGADGRAEDQ